MKKNIYLCGLFLLLSVQFVMAQNNNSILDRKFTFGPKVAFTMSDLDLNNVLESSFKPGFDVGIFFRAGGRWHLNAAIYYSFKSNTFPEMIEDLNENFELQTHNLQIPIMLGVSLVNLTNFKVRLFVGPNVGFVLSSNEPIDILSNFYYGGTAGIGFDIWRITLDAGYNFNFSKNLNQNSQVPEEFLKQNLFAFSLGIKCF